MNEWLKKIDDLIDQIPADLKDIIQKGAIALGALLVLVGILFGIVKGIKNAKPAGFQFAESSDDLFYLDQLREENKKKLKLIEDVEYDIQSLTENKLKNKKIYQTMSADTLDHLKGEKDKLLFPQDELRSQRDVPGLVTNETEPTLLKIPIQKDKTISSPLFKMKTYENKNTMKESQKSKKMESMDGQKMKKIQSNQNKRELNFIE